MFNKIKNIFKKDKKNNLSEEAKRDYEEIVLKNKNIKDDYQKLCVDTEKEIERLKKSNENPLLVENKILQEEEKQRHAFLEIQREKFERKKDILSTKLFQIDKIIYNKVFEKETPVRNKIWGLYKKMVENRYKDVSWYLTKNIAIGLLLIAACILTTKYLTILNIPMITLSSLFGVNTIIKSVSTYYNNKNFGGPKLLKRFKNLFHGKRKENINNAKYAYESSKRLDIMPRAIKNTVSSLSDLESNEEEKEDELEEIKEELKNISENNIEEMKTFEEMDTIDITDYEEKRIGMCFPNEKDTLDYITAYSFIRKNEDNDNRIEAYAKLASTYGKNPKKKKKETDITKLNNYSRMLKALSAYGKKIHDGTSTKEENATYIALLYRLGKDFDDDDVIDYLSDEYDAYIEQQKVMKKAS